MDHRLAKFQGSAMLSTRAVALFALVIAGVLGSWRASDLFTQPVEAWVPGSAVEASLMGILEPVAGKGNIRLSVMGDGSSGRSVLILLAWVGFRAPLEAAPEGKGAGAPDERKPARAESTDIIPGPKLRPVRQPDPDAASLVRKDPARTASILRSWMRGEGDAA